MLNRKKQTPTKRKTARSSRVGPAHSMMPLSTTLEQSVPLSAAFEKHLIASPGERVKHFNRNSLNLGTANRLRDLQMDFGRFNADQFRHQLMNYTEAELIKLGRSVSSAASRCLDP